MGPSFSRRDFLKGTGAATAALCLSRLRGSLPEARAAAPAGMPPAPRYSGFEDLTRKKWTWDRISKGTHYVNCWYQRACAWNVYVKDDMVLREEQAATYEAVRPDVPDYNPRGCQKGACYSHRMYDPTRLKYPLKRVGPRGAGKWKRVTWDEALTEIADKSIEVLRTSGPGAFYWDLGTALTNGCHGLGLLRTGAILDTPILDMNAEIGDHHPGAAITCGKIVFASSGDDCFFSDVILIWGGNPVYTQIPNAHFFNEARYRGAKIVTIAPDYNASAIHADLWVPVKVGSDAALALSIANVLLAEKLHDEDFLREQTDQPLLVRRDNGKFLREGDRVRGGRDDVFYVYDTASRRIREAPKRSLKLGRVVPALDGEYEATTLQGPVQVIPAFTLLREKLAGFAPEETEKITGVPPILVRSLARDIGRAKAATILTQSNFSKFYHGAEMERAQLLVLALCGHYGKKGSGFNAFPWMSIDSPEIAALSPPSLPMNLGALAVMAGYAPSIAKRKIQGYTDEMITYMDTRDIFAQGGFTNSVLFFYEYGGLKELSGRSKDWDPHLQREVDSYVQEAYAKGWQYEAKTPPRIFIEEGGNILRRVRGYPQLIKHFVPRLDLFVTVDWRMSTTGLHSDFVLPAAGWYEKDDISWGTPIAPYAHVTTRAVAPLAESRHEWEFHCLLLKKIQERAKALGVRVYKDRSGKERRLDKVYDNFTFNGRYTEKDIEKVLDALVRLSSNLDGVTWADLKKKGYARFTAVGKTGTNIGTATEVRPDDTITANTLHTEKKIPWPTLTRRMQFYVDHELFAELGEMLPTHKDNPSIGGNYPLHMTGGHTRHSIHASWRDNALMLQLQRGEPLIYMSGKDAEARGIADGDKVRARNDIGQFELMAKVSPAVRPGQVIMYHAWEPHQFPGRRSHQVAIPSPINPIQLAGGYFHLAPMIISHQPGQNDRGTRVEIEKI